MAKKPQVPDLVLPQLTEAAPADVLDGESRERERFSDADFGGVDLRSTSFSECEFIAPRFDDADLSGAHFNDSVVRGMSTASLAAPRSGWRHAVIEQSRLGVAELYRSSWQQVRISGSKLGFLNLRGASITDLVFAECTIDELDLGTARVARMSFTDCRIGTLELVGARLADVDLRGAELDQVKSLDGLAGATISELQLQSLAPQLAGHLKLIVT